MQGNQRGIGTRQQLIRGLRQVVVFCSFLLVGMMMIWLDGYLKQLPIMENNGRSFHTPLVLKWMKNIENREKPYIENDTMKMPSE